MTLLLSGAVLFLFLLFTPEVAVYSDTAERDKDIRSVKAETDVSKLQQMAALHVSASYATGTTATLLCRIALVSQVLITGGAVVGLIHMRRVRRDLDKIEKKG